MHLFTTQTELAQVNEWQAIFTQLEDLVPELVWKNSMANIHILLPHF